MSCDEAQIAYHEAGHGVVARLLGVAVDVIAVCPGESPPGYVRHKPAPAESEAMIAVAGRLAEHRYLGADTDEWALHERGIEDLCQALNALVALVGDDEERREARLDELTSRVYLILDKNWAAVERAAGRLVASKTLTGADIDACIKPAQRENSVTWHGATLNAGYWWSHADVTPRNAAMLLCGYNPHGYLKQPNGTLEQHVPEMESNDEIAPRDYAVLVGEFEDVARSISGNRSVEQWRRIAMWKRLKCHSWAREFAAAIRLARLRERARTAGKSISPDYAWVDSISIAPRQAEAGGSVEDNAAATAEASRPAPIASPHARARRDDLTAVIEKAKENALDPQDSNSVWTALVALAQSDSPPPPLIEFTAGEIKYHGSDDDVDVLCFTKKNLRDRMARQLGKTR